MESIMLNEFNVNTDCNDDDKLKGDMVLLKEFKNKTTSQSEPVLDIITEALPEINAYSESSVLLNNCHVEVTNPIQDPQKSTAIVLRKWTEDQTKFLLYLYAENFQNVGPLNKFRNRRDMWNFIADEIKKKFNIVSTGLQVETRYRCVRKRRKKVIDFNITSEEFFTKMNNEDEREDIVEQGDSSILNSRSRSAKILTKKVDSVSLPIPNWIKKVTFLKTAPSLKISSPILSSTITSTPEPTSESLPECSEVVDSDLSIDLNEEVTPPPKKYKRKTTQQLFFEKTLALKREKYKLMEKIFLEREQRKKQEAELRENRLELIREITKRSDERYLSECQRQEKHGVSNMFLNSDIHWDAIYDPVAEKSTVQPSKLVIVNPRSLNKIEIPEISFEYVDIKQEPNRLITIESETQFEPSTSTFKSSTINSTVPFIEIKSELEHDYSPSPSPNMIDSSAPPSLKRKLIENFTPISKPQMLDQACQTDDVVTKDDNELVARLKRENEQLRERLAESKIQNRFGKIPLENVKGQVKKLRYLTGFPNFITLEIIYKDIENQLSFGARMSKFDLFIMTWMKLKLDLSLNYLSILTSMTVTTITRLFYNTFDLLYTQLNEYIVWPDRTKNREDAPTVYKQVFGDKNFMIIDCFDVFPEGIGINNSTPQQDTALPELCFQASKQQSLPKRYLICFSTAGSIIYLSKPFHTEHNKRYIVHQSGLLDKINTEDIILADREFLSKSVNKQKIKTKDLVPMIKHIDGELVNVSFIMNDEYIKIKENVVKKILLVKQRIMLLTNRPPVLAVINKYGEEMYSEFVIKTACAIVNLTPSDQYDESTEENDDSDI